MAEVFLARAEGPGGFQKELVIKRILPQLAEEPEFVEMFLREARVAALLNHPNVVQLFELGRDSSTYFIAMELVDGPTLRQLLRASIRAGYPLPAPAAARIIALACEGLAYAHELALDGKPLGIVHRDISPENVLLSGAGAVKVADFGIASAAFDSSVSRPGIACGKLHYMAPEQLHGAPVDRRADVFALGVVLFELLTGVLPFDVGTDVRDVKDAMKRPADPVQRWFPNCPPPLAAAIARALELDRNRRHFDCRALQRELELYLLHAGELVGAREIAELAHRLVPKRVEETDGSVTEPVPMTESAAQCPYCHARMQLAQTVGIVVDGCPTCGGLWLDEGELQQLANQPDGLAAVASAFPAGESANPGERRCPRCDAVLTSHQFGSLSDLPVEQCSVCQGVWLPPGRAEQIVHRLRE